MSKRVTTSFRVTNEAHVGVVTVTPRAISSVPSVEPSAAAQPSGVVLSDSTSLDDLFTAILGGDAREQDDRGPLLEAVDAQVSRLRKELGLADPPPPPAPPPAATGAMLEPRVVEAPVPGDTAPPAGPAVWLRRRFEALRQGMPDVWSSVPRPVMLGLPAMALVVAGAIWLGSADSRPREVGAAAAPAPVSSTAAPALNAPVAPAAASTSSAVATPSSSVPVSTPAATGPSAPAASSLAAAPAPDPTRAARGRVSRSGADVSLGRASNASSAARPAPSPSSPLADVASPAASTAAAGSPPTAAPTSLASAAAAAPSFVASGTSTTAVPALRSDAAALAGTTTASPAAAPPSTPAVPEPTAALRDTAAAPTTAPILAPAGSPANITPAAAPVTTASTPATPAATTPAAPARGSSQPALLLSRATPVYPEAARRARVTGTVDVILSIDKQGTVVRATAVEGSPLLRPSAEDAARKWRYRPEFVNGAPVETERRVRIVFQ